MRRLRFPLDVKHRKAKEADNVYRIFCEKCVSLVDAIRAEYGVTLTPRELDNLLLEASRRRASWMPRRRA
jgi:hypothetical protein